MSVAEGKAVPIQAPARAPRKRKVLAGGER